jgi:hypothetical protein
MADANGHRLALAVADILAVFESMGLSIETISLLAIPLLRLLVLEDDWES